VDVFNLTTDQRSCDGAHAEAQILQCRNAQEDGCGSAEAVGCEEGEGGLELCLGVLLLSFKALSCR
jgi:hypothetical protein